jgi:hypothetical protein
MRTGGNARPLNESKQLGIARIAIGEANMRMPIGLIAVLCIFMTGCLSTVRIKRDPLNLSEQDKNQTDVQGIPFYTKTAHCKQETTWVQPFYTLTLKTTTKAAFVNEEAANAANNLAEATKKPKTNLPEPTVLTKNKVLSLSDYTKDPVLKLRACLAKISNVTQCDVEQLWNEIAKLLTYVPLEVTEEDLVKPELGFAVKVANSSSPELFVDYSRVYYYNSPRPWVGSSQLTAKLAADGTLSEGSAQITSQTLSTFVPVSAALSAITKIPSEKAAPAFAATPYAMEQQVHYELTIKEDAYKHTHSKSVSLSTPCPVEADGVKKDYALTITLSGEKEEKKDDGNTVKVSGSVVLPKKADDKK